MPWGIAYELKGDRAFNPKKSFICFPLSFFLKVFARGEGCGGKVAKQGKHKLDSFRIQSVAQPLTHTGALK